MSADLLLLLREACLKYGLLYTVCSNTLLMLKTVQYDLLHMPAQYGEDIDLSKMVASSPISLTLLHSVLRFLQRQSF